MNNLMKNRNSYVKVNGLLKRLTGILLVLSVCITLAGCLRTDKSVHAIWGTKKKIITILQSPQAKADKWLCVSIDD